MGRGPSYPYVDLEGAIAYTRKVYDFTKRGPAATEAVVKEGLKLSPTSSGAQKVIAALRSFGLLEDAPGANGKAVKLSNSAIRILLDDPDSVQRQDEIKKAALGPKWYEYCWTKWGKEMPPSMRSSLLIDHGFVESTVDSFLQDYRKTIAFAGLLDDIIFPKDGQSIADSNNSIRIGDWVQWDSQGILKFPAARKLCRFSDDRKFAFVEGYLSGIPAEELVAAEPPELPVVPPSVNPLAVPTLGQGDGKMQVDTLTLSEGITVQFQWPSAISKETYEDFLYQLEGFKRRIGRAVNKDTTSVLSVFPREIEPTSSKPT